MRSWLKFSFIIPSILVIALYFFTRFYNLNLIPVFVDEAIYVRWGQVMKNEPTLRFLPLQDGKQPLFMWIEMPMFKVFSDPLVAGRAVSIFAGFGTLLGISTFLYLVTKSRRASLIGAVLYTLVPYTMFFDRMALVDGLLSMFAVWSLILGWQLVKYARLDLAMLLGFTLGFGLLTKSPGFYFLGLQPLLFFSRWPLQWKRLIKFVGLWVVATIIALTMYNVLRLGPNFNLVNSRNSDYVFSFKEILSHPLDPLISNMKRTFSWTSTLFTLPLFVTVFASILFKKHRATIAILLAWAFIPLIFQGSLAKVYTTRYLLFAMPPFLICSAIFFESLISKFKWGTLLFIATLAFITFKLYPLYIDPSKADIPFDMKYGYLQEWTAGYGQKEVAQYLTTQIPSGQKVLVVTEGFFGTLPDGLQIYTQAHPNINVIGSPWPVGEIPPSLVQGSVDHLAFLVVNKSRLQIPLSQMERLKLIASYDKAVRPDGTRESLLFFQLIK